MASLRYWLWLSAAALSPRARAALLERYGDAEAAFHAPDGAFSSLSGLSRAEAALLERRDLSLADEIREECERQGIWMLSLQDAAYPPRLRQIFSPPAVLYGKGSLPAQEDEVPIAVIGTRRCSDYGRRMAAKLGGELARCGGTVVSLLTSEIEVEAARAALRAGGKVVGVLGVPHERETRPLAAEIARQGALLTELPPFAQPGGRFFRERNRIASGLSLGVLVVEAPEKSGTQLFVAEAAEQGKEIFAVPGNADARGSAGTLRMIRDGARLVTSGWEVLSEFQPLCPRRLRPAPESAEQPEPEAAPTAREDRAEGPAARKGVDKPDEMAYIDLKKQLEGLSEEQLLIVAAIEKDARHIDDIIGSTGLPTATVLSQLTRLQVRGFVRREPGQRFSLNITKK